MPWLRNVMEKVGSNDGAVRVVLRSSYLQPHRTRTAPAEASGTAPHFGPDLRAFESTGFLKSKKKERRFPTGLSAGRLGGQAGSGSGRARSPNTRGSWDWKRRQ